MAKVRQFSWLVWMIGGLSSFISSVPLFGAPDTAVGMIYDAPATSVVPALFFEGDPVAGYFIAVRASSSASVHFREDLRVEIAPQNWSTNLLALGIEAIDDSVVTFYPPVTGARPNLRVTGYHDAVGVHARNRSLVDFRGIADIRGAWDATFARLSDNSRLLLSGNVRVQQDSNAPSLGVDVTGSAFLSITGKMEVVDDGNFDATLVSVSGAAEAYVGGTLNSWDAGNGNAVLIDARNASKTVVVGTGAIRETGNGDAIGVRASGQSVVDFRGDFSLQEDGNGAFAFFELTGQSHATFRGALRGTSTGISNPPVMRLSQNASLDILGGVMSGEMERTPVIELRDHAVMNWYGGELSFHQGGASLLPRFTLNDSSVLKMHVRNANFGLGEVSALQGRITGSLADGTEFDFDFTRSSAAAIILVPEPTSSLLIGVFFVGILGGRRWRARLVVRQSRGTSALDALHSK